MSVTYAWEVTFQRDKKYKEALCVGIVSSRVVTLFTIHDRPGKIPAPFDLSKVCTDSSKWMAVISAYPDGKRAPNVCKYVFHLQVK